VLVKKLRTLEYNLFLINDICKMAVIKALLDQGISLICVMISFGSCSKLFSSSVHHVLFEHTAISFELLYMLEIHRYTCLCWN
jgi:hypothetical protein